MRRLTFTLVLILIASFTFAQVTFENPVTFTTAGDIERGYSTTIGDFDGDGDNDIVVCGYDSDNILWYANDGTGTFGTANTLTTGFNGATFTAVGDIDNDGDLDIVATSWYDGVLFFKNDGSGNFTQQTLSDNITGGWHVKIADINGDNTLDVVVTARNESSVFWFETTVDGSGDVTFSTRNTVVDGLDWVGGMDVGDIDGDGDMDVAVASLGYANSTSLLWYANDGTGTFTFKQDDMFTPASDYDQLERVWIGDLDNDGDNDIVFGVYSNGNGYEITWVENSNGFGLFTSAQNIQSGVAAAGFTDMLIVDIDADNDLDIVYSYSYGTDDDKIAYLENENDASSFSYNLVATVATTTAEPPWVDGLNAGDLDGDNDIDITYAEYRCDYAAWIETNVLPSIYEQCINVETCAGQDTIFGIKANLADSYEWQVDEGSGFSAITDGGVYSGATTDTLSINGLTASMTGYIYKCVVTNGDGNSTSDNATLTVSQNFAITSQPQSASLEVGDNASLSVVTDYTDNLTYQWRFNGTDLTNDGTISGATTSNLQITGVTVHDDGDYDCVITGICNEETSDVATLTVTLPGGINNIEDNISIYPNPTTGIINLTVSARPVSVSNIEIADITGKTIKQFSITNQKSIINLENQPSGIYFIKIQTTEKMITKKIVIK